MPMGEKLFVNVSLNLSQFLIKGYCVFFFKFFKLEIHFFLLPLSLAYSSVPFPYQD